MLVARVSDHSSLQLVLVVDLDAAATGPCAAGARFANQASSRARRSTNGSARRSSPSIDQRIVEAHVGGKLLELLLGHALAVEALLQVVERRDLAVAHHQQLAVEHRIEIAGRRRHRESSGRCRRRCASRGAPRPPVATICTRMPSHFHSAENSARSSAAQSLSSSACDSISGRNTGAFGHVRLRRAALQPGEQRLVGRREAVPDLLDVIHLEARHVGHRRLGQPRRDADAHGARQQLQQRPAARRIERVEPGFQPRPQIVAADQRELGNDVGEAAVRFRLARPLPSPLRGGG